jgi:hypothetical protein
VTGFLFPLSFPRRHCQHRGWLSPLSVLILAAIALAGKWSRTYVSLTRDRPIVQVLVLIIQLFAKGSALHPAAPAGTEPTVGATEGVALLVYFVIAVMAVWCSLYRLG